MSFADDIKRFAGVVDRRVSDVFIGSVKDAHASIAIGSPVTGSPGQPSSTGYLRASWGVGADTPAFPLAGDLSDNVGTTEAPMPMTPMDPGVESALRSGSATRAVIATNVDYAPAVEDRSGSHAKSVASTVANFPRIVEKNVRDVTGGQP